MPLVRQLWSLFTIRERWQVTALLAAMIVQAFDDGEVTGVTVTLTDAGGTELETGPAVLDGTRWRYDAQTAVASGSDVTVTAEATDRPGNTADLVVTVTTP